MQRYFFGFFITVMLGLSGTVTAKDFTDKYTAVSIRDLTEFSSHYPVIDLKDDKALLEYLKITNCPTYDTVKDDQFKLQAMKEAILKQRAATPEANRALFFYIPAIILTTGYNFDVQALDIYRTSQWNRVSSFDLYTDTATAICNENAMQITNIPITYTIRLNAPISMHRIPLQRSVAESLVSKLDKNAKNVQTKIIYANVYLQVDPVTPELWKPPEKNLVFVRGQVNAINLYVDKDRKILFKQLNYSDSF